jgi:D-hydroxyproline dehydrogenase subunit alpha
MDHKVDLAVIGGGPAGLEACLAAAETGLKIVLIDSDPHLGGQYFKPSLTGAAHKDQAQRQRQELVEKISALRVTVHNKTLVWAGYPHEDGGWQLALHGNNTSGVILARTVIIATGAYDLPLPFPGWTIPGVMTAGAALILLKQQTLPGKRIVLSGSGPLQLGLAASLVKSGQKPLSVLEAKPLGPQTLKMLPALWGQWARLQEGFDIIKTLGLAGIPYQQGWTVTAGHGQEEIEAVEISRLDLHGFPIPGSQRMIPVDTCIVGYGLLPNNGLARQMGCQGAYGARGEGFIIQRDEFLHTSLPGIIVAGDAAWIGGAYLARLEGRLSGLSAARYLNRIEELEFQRHYKKLKPFMVAQRRFAAALNQVFQPAEGLYSLAKDETIICRCEEISLGEIKAAAAGAGSPNEIKLLTRSGMGFCQGRICEHYLVEHLRRVTHLDSPGTFSIRPPLHPLPAEVLAGYTQYT